MLVSTFLGTLPFPAPTVLIMVVVCYEQPLTAIAQLCQLFLLKKFVLQKDYQFPERLSGVDDGVVRQVKLVGNHIPEHGKLFRLEECFKLIAQRQLHRASGDVFDDCLKGLNDVLSVHVS